MSELAAVKSLRYRYVLGLAAIALLVTASFVTMHFIIDKQSDYGHLIFVAGGQNGQANRIAHFAGQMAFAQDEYEYEISRAQLGRAVNAMQRAHLLLLTGNEEAGIPQVMTEDLAVIYFDNTVGLDLAVNRFLGHARDIYGLRYGELRFNTSSYVYLINYGPHVLEPMLNSAVEAYEAFSRRAIARIKRFETGLWVCALLALLSEALFIYRPLESKVRATVEELEAKNDALHRTIMEIAQAQDDMERQKNRAERANRAKTEFLSNMSHELRTPLNAIIGLADLLLQIKNMRDDPDRLVDYLTDIRTSGAHLLSLVNEILDVSIIESGNRALQTETFDAVEEVENALRPLRATLLSSAPRLSVTTTGKPVLVAADRQSFRQIVLNLANNSITHGGSDVKVEIRVDPDVSGEFVRILVADNGPGIPADLISTIGQPFPQALTPYQATTGSNGTKGAGLGLYIVNRLLALNGGKFSLESEMGKGTVVTTLWPKTANAA